MTDRSKVRVAVATRKSRYWWFEEKPPGTLEGYALTVVTMLFAVWAIVVVGLGFGDRLVIATVYAMPFVMTFALWLSVRVARLGTSNLPLVPTSLGLGFLIGGPVLDLAATVTHSPDLAMEGNPVARALLDSDHSLFWVYRYAFATQAMLIATACALWIGLLRHRDQIVQAVGRHAGFWEFFKAATGGGPLTWRQWLFPVKASEIPHPYHYFWIFVVAFVSGAIDRWAVALNWYGLVPLEARWAILGTSMTLGVTAYFAWLRRATRV